MTPYYLIYDALSENRKMTAHSNQGRHFASTGFSFRRYFQQNKYKSGKSCYWLPAADCTGCGLHMFIWVDTLRACIKIRFHRARLKNNRRHIHVLSLHMICFTWHVTKDNIFFIIILSYILGNYWLRLGNTTLLFHKMHICMHVLKRDMLRVRYNTLMQQYIA